MATTSHPRPQEEELGTDDPPPAYEATPHQGTEQTLEYGPLRPFQPVPQVPPLPHQPPPNTSTLAPPSFPFWNGANLTPSQTGFQEGPSTFAPPPGPGHYGRPQSYAPPPGPPPSHHGPPPLPTRPPPKWAPTTVPTPGQPLLHNGKVLVYPNGFVCEKCFNTGYKPNDPTHPCRKDWEKYSKPFSAAFHLAPDQDPAPNFQKPLRAFAPPSNVGGYPQHHQNMSGPPTQVYVGQRPPNMNGNVLVLRPGDPRMGSNDATKLLLSFATVAKSWRAAALAVAYNVISLPSICEVVLFSRTLTKEPSFGSHVRKLDLKCLLFDRLQITKADYVLVFCRVSDVFQLGNKSTQGWKGHDVQRVFRSCEALSSLSLHLGPKTFSYNLNYIAKDLQSTFGTFKNLTSFNLSSSIWLSDLALLLDFWPALSSLTLHDVRGDCSSIPPSPRLVSLKHLDICNNNTLNSQHINWFINNQPFLTHLIVALPGFDPTIFTALSTRASTITTLRLTNRFTTKGPAPPPASSLLLPFLALSARLSEVQISPGLVPAEKFDEFMESLDQVGSVTKIWIEESSKSELRDALEKALRCEGVLEGLREVVSVGGKKGKGAVADSSFLDITEELGIEWTKE